MGFASDERAALCALLDEVGPDAPTLCEGWQARDLAAHLVIRERRPDAAIGILVPPLSGYLRKVQDGFAGKPWPELVELVRTGPPGYWPTSVPALDEAANTAEFLVHHEDVRRAQPDWHGGQPATEKRENAAWKQVNRTARLTLRRCPVGVVLHTRDGRQTVVKSGPDPVTLTGHPLDLLVYAFGRDEVDISFDGSAAAIRAIRDTRRGI